MENKGKQRRVDFDSRAKLQHAVVTKLVPDHQRARAYDNTGNRKATTPNVCAERRLR